MLSKEQLESYRKMTPGERLEVSMELTAFDLRFLDSLPPEEGLRRWGFILRRHEEGNRRLLEALGGGP